MRSEALPTVEPVDACHLVGTQLEPEDVGIGLDAWGEEHVDRIQADTVRRLFKMEFRKLKKLAKKIYCFQKWKNYYQ